MKQEIISFIISCLVAIGITILAVAEINYQNRSEEVMLSNGEIVEVYSIGKAQCVSACDKENVYYESSGLFRQSTCECGIK